MRLAVVAMLGVALLAGCKPDLPTDPEENKGLTFLRVTGTWSYSATELRLAGTSGPAPCSISGMMLTLTQIERAGAFSGRSSGGQMTCTGDLSFLSGPLIDYAIGNGYTVNQYISFDLGAPGWRHDGLVVTTDSVAVDSMSGNFTLKNGGLEFQGRFRALRQTGQ